MKLPLGLLLIASPAACQQEPTASFGPDNHYVAAATGPMLVIVDAGAAVRSENGRPVYEDEQGRLVADAVTGSGQYLPGAPSNLELLRAAYKCSPLTWVDRSMSHVEWVVVPASASPLYARTDHPTSDAEIVDCIKRGAGASFRVGRIESSEQLPDVQFLSEEQLNARAH